MIYFELGRDEMANGGESNKGPHEDEEAHLSNAAYLTGAPF